MDSSHDLSLMAKHAGLEDRIAAEARRPNPDTLLIASLKKKKLRLKEELDHHP